MLRTRSRVSATPSRLRPFGAAALALLLVGLVAGCIPTRRATTAAAIDAARQAESRKGAATETDTSPTPAVPAAPLPSPAQPIARPSAEPAAAEKPATAPPRPAAAPAQPTGLACPSTNASIDPFFAGLEPLSSRLAGLSAPTVGADGTVEARPEWMPAAEREVRVAIQQAGRRVGSLFVVGVVQPFALPPEKAADVIFDAAAERASLSAEEGVEVSRSRVGSADVVVMRCAMLDMGEWPFLYDFRWSFRITRESRPDGTVLLRYALEDDAPREHVAYFSGVATLTPSPGGSVLREAFAVGSDLSPPFFFKARVSETVMRILSRRWSRLSTHSR